MFKSSAPTKKSTDLVFKTQKHIKYPREIVPLSPDSTLADFCGAGALCCSSIPSMLLFQNCTVATESH
jgi:hypothetical protein